MLEVATTTSCNNQRMSAFLERVLNAALGEKIFIRASADSGIDLKRSWVWCLDQQGVKIGVSIGGDLDRQKEIMDLLSHYREQFEHSRAISKIPGVAITFAPLERSMHKRISRDQKREVWVADDQNGVYAEDKTPKYRSRNFISVMNFFVEIRNNSVCRYWLEFPYSTGKIPVIVNYGAKKMDDQNISVSLQKGEGPEQEITEGVPIALSLGQIQLSLEAVLQLYSGSEIQFKRPAFFDGALYLAGAPYASAAIAVEEERVTVKIKEIFADNPQLLPRSCD
jgi:hypothetical protein